MARQQIDIEFNDDGSARITIPGGKAMRVTDPAKVAELTKKIAEALGPITERHAAHTHIYLDDGTERIEFHQGGGDAHQH